jgi:hypothetical protein
MSDTDETRAPVPELNANPTATHAPTRTRPSFARHHAACTDGGVVPGFEIESKIGRGGITDVYKPQQPGPSRTA